MSYSGAAAPIAYSGLLRAEARARPIRSASALNLPDLDANRTTPTSTAVLPFPTTPSHASLRLPANHFEMSFGTPHLRESTA